MLNREEAQKQLRDYQRTLILAGNTKEARQLGEAIAQLARGEEEEASKTLTQSSFSLEQGRREIRKNDTSEEPEEGEEE